MNKELLEFYKNKISKLSDEKLLELIEIDSNKEITNIAYNEAISRELNIESIGDINTNSESENDFTKIDSEEFKKLKKWNWGAFLLSGLWAFGNKLTLWAILSFIPGLNLIVIFYLGSKGNQLAWEKSNSISIEDFIKIQDYWSKWGIRFFWITLFISLTFWILIG
jgi:hypothetical protein